MVTQKDLYSDCCNLIVFGFYFHMFFSCVFNQESNIRKIYFSIYWYNLTITVSDYSGNKYYYIIKLLRKNRKERTKIKAQLKCTCISARSNENNNLLKNRFYIIYPSMIIASFILFMVLPTFIIGLVNEHIYPLTNEASQTVRVLYPIGFIIDPLLYIFNLDVIRKRARRIFTCWRKK